jgi:formylmethanofuran--tetrahydromethanopterin N-formyltransferase
MQLGPTLILDTFAEAFRMRFARLVVTAADEHWLDCALREFCGYGSSVIGCDAEVGVERRLAPDESPDGRPGAAALAFGFSTDAVAAAVANRTGQCLMTCPTTAAFNGLAEAEEQVPLGKHLRFFGDGFQKSKQVGDRRYWRIPVMDGEFLVEEQIGVAKGVAGGNIIIQGATQEAALAAARQAVDAVAPLAGVITPFPGGVVRSGSKVASKYKALRASTNEGFCPTLRGRVVSELVDGAQCAYEIVINGVDEPTIAAAMRSAIHAAAGDGALAIGAGNYGGKLGKFHFPLREIAEMGRG